jgi:hypothetical protein
MTGRADYAGKGHWAGETGAHSAQSSFNLSLFPDVVGDKLG